VPAPAGECPPCTQAEHGTGDKPNDAAQAPAWFPFPSRGWHNPLVRLNLGAQKIGQADPGA